MLQVCTWRQGLEVLSLVWFMDLLRSFSVSLFMQDLTFPNQYVNYAEGDYGAKVPDLSRKSQRQATYFEISFLRQIFMVTKKNVI